MDEEHAFGKYHPAVRDDAEHVNARGKDIRRDAYKIACGRRVQFHAADYTPAAGEDGPRLGNAVEDHGHGSGHAVVGLGDGKGASAVENGGKIKVVVLAAAAQAHRIA